MVSIVQEIEINGIPFVVDFDVEFKVARERHEVFRDITHVSILSVDGRTRVFPKFREVLLGLFDEEAALEEIWLAEWPN